MNKLKLHYIFLLMLLFFLFSTKKSFSQTNIHSLGFDIGGISRVSSKLDLIVYPEIFIMGDFITSNFNWKINGGYWNSDTKYAGSYDSYFYSYSSLVLGAELLYLLPITNLDHLSPFRLLTGLSYHYINAKDEAIYESEIENKNGFTQSLFYFDIGLEIHVLLKSNLTMFIKGISHFRLSEGQIYLENVIRYQLSLGVNYNFKL